MAARGGPGCPPGEVRLGLPGEVGRSLDRVPPLRGAGNGPRWAVRGLPAAERRVARQLLALRRHGRGPGAAAVVGMAARASASGSPQALSAAVDRLANRVRFHAWLQFVAQEQWNAVARLCAGAGGCSSPATSRSSSARTAPTPGPIPVTCGATPGWASRRTTSPTPGRTGACPTSTSRRWRRTTGAGSASGRCHAAAVYDLRRVDHAVGYFRQYIRDEKTPRGRFLPPEEPLQQRLGTDASSGSSPTGAASSPRTWVSFRRSSARRSPSYRSPATGCSAGRRTTSVFRDPHAFPEVSLVTTGTHDTETLREWWEARDRRRAARRGRGLAGVRGSATAARRVHPRGPHPAAGHRRERRLAALRPALAGRARRDRADQPPRLGAGRQLGLPHHGSGGGAGRAAGDVREAAARLRTLTQAAHRLSDP